MSVQPLLPCYLPGAIRHDAGSCVDGFPFRNGIEMLVELKSYSGCGDSGLRRAFPDRALCGEMRFRKGACMGGKGAWEGRNGEWHDVFLRLFFMLYNMEMPAFSL